MSIQNAEPIYLQPFTNQRLNCLDGPENRVFKVDIRDAEYRGPMAMEMKLKIAKLIAKGIYRVQIVAPGFLVALLMFAPYVTAQVEYVDPTIGNVGILLVQPNAAATFVSLFPMAKLQLCLQTGCRATYESKTAWCLVRKNSTA